MINLLNKFSLQQSDLEKDRMLRCAAKVAAVEGMK